MSDSRASALFGPQEVTQDDREYTGSRFSEVRAAISENPYQPVWGGEGNDPWPVYEATFAHAFAGILPGGRRDELLAAARRTVDFRADLRWGEDRRGFRRILHPNGICLFGLWEMSEDNPYSGYFKPGSRGLVIGRFSPPSTPHRGHNRSLSLAAKIYPTTDEDHAEPLVPANFFVQEDLGTEWTRYINDAEMLNSPHVTALRRFLVGTLILARLGRVFGKVDKVATARQVHEIAELAKPDDEPTNAPEFMRLKMTPGQRRIEGEGLDFRDEVYGQIFDRGDPQAKRELSFDVFVSNTGRIRRVTPLYKRTLVKDWQKIGHVRFNHAVASYNGDHVLHFHHPAWREDRNDPATAVRVDGRRAR